MFLNLKNLDCVVCLNILEDPQLIDCPGKCIACKQCILGLFRMTPEEFDSEGPRILGDSEVAGFGVKCLCNAEVIFVDQIKPDIVTTSLVKHLTLQCPNHLNGCQWFSDKNTSEDTMDQHTRNCR